MNFIKNETCYSCGSDVAKAVKEYNNMIGKDFKSHTSSGRKKQYFYSDTQCPFNLVFYVKKGSGQRASPLISIPEGYWYVSQFKGHGGSCQSQVKLSAKQLSKFTAFHSAVLGTRNKTATENLLKSGTGNVHNVGNLSHAMIQRARDMVKKRSEDEEKKSYGRIPALCFEILKLNPGSRISCQADSEGRFYRVFVRLKSSVHAINNGCVPIIEVDGAFMKHPYIIECVC